MLDPYASCPCGSGKKFKWCCQPIHVEIDKAVRLDEEGQHEAALKLMAEVVKAHPANPEAFGRQAQLLFENDRVEEAENALQKAFDINPNYPFGHFLRGLFRFHEGELPGALLLFRKAAELYDPQAHDILAQLYGMIADCETRLNRPVAARAALEITLRCRPGDEELRKGFEEAFGAQSRMPESARRKYTFLSPAPGVTGERRKRWDRVLAGTAAGKLSDAAWLFGELAGEDPEDAAAWYNLAVARAWVGDNARALEALDRYVALEQDEAKASAAWALGEVLRAGQGMEAQADYLEYSAAFQVSDPNFLPGLLQAWEQEHRLTGVQASEQQPLLSALILEKAPVLTAGTAGGQVVPLAAYFLLAGDLLRVWFVKKESVDKLAAELQQRAGGALSPPHEHVRSASFTDRIMEAVVFPAGQMPPEEVERRMRDHAAGFFEETWIHRPLKSLNHIAPIDAAGHASLRKKLRGVIQFLQECAVGTMSLYDFDRLRRKLGLLGTPAPGSAAAQDIGGMGAAELAVLNPESLSDAQLQEAYQAALKLDAQELAAGFARALVTRPAEADGRDRYPWYQFLVQHALTSGKPDEALDLVNAGEQFDCARNEGRRRNDYELRRGLVLAKRGDAEQAQDVFNRLIERDPANLRYRGSAAEAMLSLRQGKRALHFAEGGLAAARKENNRDQEQYFLELQAAAKKLG